MDPGGAGHMTPWWVSWLTAVGTITGVWMVRRLLWQGYLIGLINQALWWWITVATEQWGFVAIHLFMTYNYWRGIIEWRRNPGLRYAHSQRVRRATPKWVSWIMRGFSHPSS